MDNYSLLYKGMRKKTKEAGFVPVHYLASTGEPNVQVLARDLDDRFREGDTLRLINAENSYFEIDYTRADRSFTLYPRVQMNETMDMIVYSPDIRHRLDADIYTHVRTFPDPASDVKWSAWDTLSVTKDEPFFVNDYVATFKGASIEKSIDGFRLQGNDFAVRAEVEIQGEYDTYQARPVYIVQKDRVGRVADEVSDLGVQLNILAIDAANKAMEEELKEKQRLAEEEAARKKKEAEGPSLEDIPPDEMLAQIESIREIMEFSDVEKEIRTMCEQSSVPKALVDIAVSDPDKLDELEKKAEG
jgi:cytochrome c-type biogenesis protein CcmF